MPKLRNGSRLFGLRVWDSTIELHDKFLLSLGKVEVLDLFIHCSGPGIID